MSGPTRKRRDSFRVWKHRLASYGLVKFWTTKPFSSMKGQPTTGMKNKYHQPDSQLSGQHEGGAWCEDRQRLPLWQGRGRCFLRLMKKNDSRSALGFMAAQLQILVIQRLYHLNCWVLTWNICCFSTMFGKMLVGRSNMWGRNRPPDRIGGFIHCNRLVVVISWEIVWAMDSYGSYWWILNRE